MGSRLASFGWCRTLLIASVVGMALAAPARATTADRFYLGGIDYPHPLAWPGRMTTGPDGAVWFITLSGVGRMSPDGQVSRFATGRDFTDLAAGPDGNLWLSDDENRRIVSLSPTGSMREFRTPRGTLGPIAAGPDGAMWFARDVPGPPIDGHIGRITPDGRISEVATVPEQEVSDLVTGPDGNVWFTASLTLGKVTPSGKVTLLRNLVDIQSRWFRSSIVVGGDGRLWAAGLVERRLVAATTDGRVTLMRAPPDSDALVPHPDGTMWVNGKGPLTRVDASGRVVQRVSDPFGVATGCRRSERINSFTGGIAVDRTGQLWAADFNHSSLMRVTSALGTPPSPLAPVLSNRGLHRRPFAVAAASDALWVATDRALVRIGADRQPTLERRIPRGRHVLDLSVARDGTVWFTEWPARIGRLMPSGRLRRYGHGLPRRASLGGLALAADGTVWFTGRRFIGRLSRGGRIRLFRRGLLRRSELLDITRGPRGTMWFTDQKDRVGRVTRRGQIKTYRVRRRSNPVSIVAGSDGNLWFTMFRGRIGRITPGGRIRDFRVGQQPTAITSGSDGALWFTTGSADASDETLSGLGRITPTGRVRRFYVRPTCSTSPFGIASGPDGGIWFTEGHGPIGLARMDPSVATGPARPKP